MTEATTFGQQVLYALQKRDAPFFARLLAGPGEHGALPRPDEIYLFGSSVDPGVPKSTKSVLEVVDSHEIATTIDPQQLANNERGEPVFRIFFYDRALAKLSIPPTAAEQELFMKTWASITVTKGQSGWYCQEVFDRKP